jgi:ribonuclease P protein component
MLKQRYRLKSQGLFKRTLNAHRLCGTDCFAVFALKRNPELATRYPTRFGFIVSKKIHKRAVRRNRIKRRLREIIRTRLLTDYQERLQQYATIVVVARPGSLEASYQQMEEKLVGCFKRSG